MARKNRLTHHESLPNAPRNALLCTPTKNDPASCIAHCYRPSSGSSASLLRAALCSASVCCIFCMLYFGSIKPIWSIKSAHTVPTFTQALPASLPFSKIVGAAALISPAPCSHFSCALLLPIARPLGTFRTRTILNNLHAGSLGCAPTPSQYFARDVSSFISLKGLPPSPSGAGFGIGS